MNGVRPVYRAFTLGGTIALQRGSKGCPVPLPLAKIAKSVSRSSSNPIEHFRFSQRRVEKDMDSSQIRGRNLRNYLRARKSFRPNNTSSPINIVTTGTDSVQMFAYTVSCRAEETLDARLGPAFITCVMDEKRGTQVLKDLFHQYKALSTLEGHYVAFDGHDEDGLPVTEIVTAGSINKTTHLPQPGGLTGRLVARIKGPKLLIFDPHVAAHHIYKIRSVFKGDEFLSETTGQVHVMHIKSGTTTTIMKSILKEITDKNLANENRLERLQHHRQGLILVSRGQLSNVMISLLGSWAKEWGIPTCIRAKKEQLNHSEFINNPYLVPLPINKGSVQLAQGKLTALLPTNIDKIKYTMTQVNIGGHDFLEDIHKMETEDHQHSMIIQAHVGMCSGLAAKEVQVFSSQFDDLSDKQVKLITFGNGNMPFANNLDHLSQDFINFIKLRNGKNPLAINRNLRCYSKGEFKDSPNMEKALLSELPNGIHSEKELVKKLRELKKSLAKDQLDFIRSCCQGSELLEFFAHIDVFLAELVNFRQRGGQVSVWTPFHTRPSPKYFPYKVLCAVLELPETNGKG